jgi:hypothetical protein
MAYFKLIATQVGTGAGPFTIKSNTGAVLVTGVTGAQLLAGYIFDVPAGVISVTVENVATNTVCATSETYLVPDPGFWEMQKSGAELVSDHYGVLLNPYVVPVHAFAAAAVTGVYGGVVSGTGEWLIKGGPEAIGGIAYPGGGTLIATAVNTNTATRVESGATLQIGYDLNALSGRVSQGGTLTVDAGGVVNVVGANETPGRIAIDALVNNGQVTFEGPDVCGEGYFQNGGVIGNAGTITVKENANFRFSNSTTFSGQVGTIRVEDGGTLEQNGVSTPSTQTLALNGCGKCTNIGKQDGAMLVSGSGTIASPIVLESDVCMDHVGSGAATISGRISGAHKLTLNNKADSATRQGTWSFTSNTAPFFNNTLEVKNTTLYDTGANALSKADVVFLGTGYMQSDGGAINIGSIASPDATTGILLNSSGSITLKENGETTYAGAIGNSTPGTPWTLTLDGPATNKLTLTGAGSSAVNLASNTGSRIVVQGGHFNQWTGTGTISGGASTAGRINTLTINASSALDVYASGTGTGMVWASNALNTSVGWSVNVMDALPAGTYNILRKPNSVAATLPVIGTNASGLTATFANVGSFITMTLA